MPKIYCDMDGVLTDFDKAAGKAFGVPSEEAQDFLTKNSKKGWGLISKAGEEFWSKMEWLPDGRELWEGISIYKPTILSSPTRHESSVAGKKIWLKENIPDVPYIIDSDKAQYAKAGDILIDDRTKNTETWKKAGGVAILHKDTKDTLAQLKKILGKSKKAAIHNRLRDIATMLTTIHRGRSYAPPV